MHQEDDRLGPVSPVESEGRQPEPQRQAENQRQGPSLVPEEVREPVVNVIAPHVVNPLTEGAHAARHDA